MNAAKVKLLTEKRQRRVMKKVAKHGCYIFMESKPCALIGWGLHTIAHCYITETSGTQPLYKENKKTQAKGSVSADADTATHFYWVISDDV